MSWMFALFMVVASAAPKLAGAKAAIDPMVAIGWPPRHLLLIAIIEITGTILFLYPRTALVGAVLLTGLLGGAMASHLRAGSPLASHTLFGLYLGAFMWAALWLRDDTVRIVFPFMQGR
jgi:uncharacterized membrane protein YphA (DoxX/SURF4 family)